MAFAYYVVNTCTEFGRHSFSSVRAVVGSQETQVDHVVGSKFTSDGRYSNVGRSLTCKVSS